MSRPEMESKEKLAEAKYFLNRIQAERNLQVVKFFFSAFMSAIHSVMDIALCDFAAKLGLGLRRDKKFSLRDFEIAALASNNEKYADFLAWRRAQMAKYESLPIWGTRNVLSHRGYPNVSQTVVNVSGFSVPIDAAIWLGYANLALKGYSSDGLAGSENPVNLNPPLRTSPRFYLGDYPNAELGDLCQSLYDAMHKTVQEAEKKFWA